MVTTNFQTFGTKGFNLRFRMYQSGEVRYISVNSLLRGNLLSKHWNQKKQMFIPSAPYSEENNDILTKFKAKYDAALMEWEGSLFSFSLTARKEGVENITRKEGKSLSDVLNWVVDNAKQAKHADGTLCGTFETYMKVIRRLEEYCNAKNVKYSSIMMSDVDVAFINDTLDWIKESKDGRGQYFSSMFRAALNKAADQGWIDTSIINQCRWIKRIRNNERKYETLTAEQCEKFLKMTKEELPSGPKAQLYRDFCVFILYTCQSACDALSLTYANVKKIDGVDHFVFKRRKIERKQLTECTVPINSVMWDIMGRWKFHCDDDYVLPVRNKRKIAKDANDNSDIKCFVKKCNVWLKKLGKKLGCDFPLRTYTFRHTGITHYISKGIPIIYVANLAGTSVDNCEKIYYNNRGDVTSRNKVLTALSF